MHTEERPDPADAPRRTASYRVLARFTDLCLDVVAVAAAVAFMALAEVVARLFGWLGVAEDLSGVRLGAGIVAGPRAETSLQLFDEVRAMTWRLLHPRPCAPRSPRLQSLRRPCR